MKEGQHIEQQQTMRTVLAPQQVQFMRLLEMNGPALEEEVQRQLDDNPALEVAEPLTDAHDMQGDQSPEQYDMSDPDDDPADRFTPRADVSYTPVYADDSADLLGYLRTQLGVTRLDDEKKAIAEYIIGNIDDDGYLTRSYEELADDILINTGIDYTPNQIEDVARVIQSFDPPGVGATDIWESLRLQLDRISPVTLATRNAREIVANYADLLAKKHYDRIKMRLGLSDESLREALDVIRRLNPAPGRAVSVSLADQKLNQITPDVGVDYDNGRLSVYLINRIPALQIESSFAADSPLSVSLKGDRRNSEAGSFIKAKRDEAETFIQALKQRSSTLLKVAEAIVRLQKDFFITGDESKLRPMILEDIKALTDLDISVISRATKDKYIETASATYPLKRFFNEAPTDDPELSAHKIKDEIRKIIEAEDPRHPLSDSAISDTLVASGLNIARRTVTKYRKDMGIPDSRLRKYGM